LIASKLKLRLLNKYEEVTYDALNQVCADVGAHVFPKVRIADVFGLDGSRISSSHYSYALKAHFDFVVTDSSYQPLFSVEFDGPSHKKDTVQQNRDVLKEDLCDSFDHGLLRINNRYLTKEYRGLDLLTYFVDAWFLEKAFFEAQRNGYVSYYETFDITFIYSGGSRNGKKWPYWLSIDLQLAIQDLHRIGSVDQMAPSHYVGLDEGGNYLCLSWITLGRNRLIRIYTGIRTQRFPSVCEPDLISMLAMFDLYEQIKSTIKGIKDFSVPCEEFFQDELPQFESRYQLVNSFTCGKIS